MSATAPFALQERYFSASRAVAALLARICRGGRRFASHFRRTRALLGTLPLTTQEFALARQRLANARQSLRAGEAGRRCTNCG
jgi:hypothetical protein